MPSAAETLRFRCQAARERLGHSRGTRGVDELGDALGCEARGLVLPDAHDRPPCGLKRDFRRLVAHPVRLDLVSPPLGVLD